MTKETKGIQVKEKPFHNFKSRTKGELIPAVIFEFHGGLMNFVITEDNYKQEKSHMQWLKILGVSLKELKKIHHLLLNPEDFPTKEWEP